MPATPGTKDLRLEREGAVAVVTLCRPPNNFLDAGLVAAIADTLFALDDKPDCRAVVLAAEGKHFCAGADFSRRLDGAGGARNAAGRSIYQEACRLVLSRKPIVAAVHGAAIGAGLGLAFGFLTGLSRPAERLLDSSVQMLRNIPHLALIPLVILWFGIDEAAKLFLVALGSFFPIYVNTMHGVRSVDPQLVEMGRAYGMDRRTLFRRVVLPGALPSIFVGLRYGLGIMWLTLIVAETIAANSGIGYMAMHAREFMLTDVVVFSILVYALLGKLADSTARLLERLCLAWNPAYRAA